MATTKAAWGGSQAAASWRAFTASTMSDTAHTPQEPHVLEQSSRFYTPHLKGQERLGPAIGPVQGAALAIGVEQQHLESIRKCASQVG